MVWLATTSVRFMSSRSASRSTTTCSTGRRAARSRRSTRPSRSQPERVSGWVDTMISS